MWLRISGGSSRKVFTRDLRGAGIGHILAEMSQCCRTMARKVGSYADKLGDLRADEINFKVKEMKSGRKTA
jgi:hypothetical protein